MKKYLICFYLLAGSLAGLAQPTLLEPGMRRNTAQTLMGKAKIDSYKSEKTVYTYPAGVRLNIEFDKEQKVSGFFWSAKQETDLVKTIEENGFIKKDSVTFSSPVLKGLLKREQQGAELIFRFVPSVATEQATAIKQAPPKATIPKEKPVYGLTILGMKVWEPKEKQ